VSTDTRAPVAPFTIAISLKMYFGRARTIAWCDEVGHLAATHPAVQAGDVELVVLPTFPAIAPARHALLGSPVQVGAQDLWTEDVGAFTGEVSGAELAEIGCTFVEVGHAERRRIFGETDNLVGAKVVAALRNGLIPIICVGETTRGPAGDAADECLTELDRVLAPARNVRSVGRIVVAYEPQWAINAPAPAPVTHIATVCGRLNAALAGDPSFPQSRSIYGGSAGPGLLTALGGDVRGLFLGRFAHDPQALAKILDETLLLKEASAC